MSKKYVQMKFASATFAKTITEYSLPGNVLDGWKLVCIHPHFHQGTMIEYIATFVAEDASIGPRE